MKTEVSRPLHTFWQALSEVPGWPDAPLTARLRRLLPLAVPVIASLAILAWTHLLREPHRQTVRAAQSELLSLEEEIVVLRQDCSEQLAAETVARAASARAQLLDSPAALTPRLEALAIQTRQLGWEMATQVYGVVEEDGASGLSLMAHVPGRVNLTPRPDNTDPFNSLITALDRLTGPAGLLEITRVSIRADVPGVALAEVNIRAACRPVHEEAPQ